MRSPPRIDSRFKVPNSGEPAKQCREWVDWQRYEAKSGRAANDLTCLQYKPKFPRREPDNSTVHRPDSLLI